MGDYIHISAYTSLFAGNARIVLEDFVTISSRTAIYAITDDYSGNYMPNPLIPNKYRNVQAQEIKFHRHTLIGTGCTCIVGSRSWRYSYIRGNIYAYWLSLKNIHRT